MFKVPGESNGQTDANIFLEAMSKDKVHLARFILDALDGKIVDSKTEGARTPLINSVLLPDCRTRCIFMELLIRKGASVNCQDESGRTALSYACEKGYLDAVKILVKNNADPEMIDTWGNTALMYAAVAGHSLVVEFLVRAFKRLGLQINRQNKVGNSALEVAKYLGHTDCIFALTSNAKKVHEYDAGVLTDLLDCTVGEEKFERKLDPVSLHEHQTGMALSNRSVALDGVWLSKATGRRRNSLILKSRLQSMDSIEEFDRENDSSPSSPPDRFFSGVLTPKPPPRANSFQTSVCIPSNPGGKWAQIDCHLPPLRATGHHTSVLYSPRPDKNTSKCCAPISVPASSPLGILLTPLAGKKVGKEEPEKEIQKPTDFGVRRFDESYYEKRCSLPTSILSPAPPDRSVTPLRKTKTIWRRPPPPNVNTEHFEATAPVATSTTFSTLSNRLLRRFTFPEFKTSGKEDRQEDTLSVSGRGIPHSEKFALSKGHPQVGSKPSIDSISAVKCEFDFHFRTPD